MAKKKATEEKKRIDPSVEGLHAEIVEQPICQTLETNYMPEVHTAVYPDSGASRVVELTFTYPETAAELREKQQAVTDSLRAASVYVRYREKETDKAELLLSYLTERFAYTQKQTDTPVYSLLCEGYATSQSMPW